MRIQSGKKVALLLAVLAGLQIATAEEAIAQEKVAVLISTGNTTSDDTYYHSEYWYDLMLMYRMLIENGFTHDNIHVLYGNGSDFASTHTYYQNPYASAMTDYAVSRTNIQNIFNWLAVGNAAQGISAMTSNDFLFVWWMGHGSGGAACNTTFDVMGIPSQAVTDTELAAWTAPIAHDKRAFVFMTCHSGGAMDNLQDVVTVSMPSCTCAQSSYSDSYDVVHGEWTYLVAAALRKMLPDTTGVTSDADGNLLVSLQETFNWASSQPMGSTPQLSDLGAIAPCVFLKSKLPGDDIEIYSRDHGFDDGTVPSNYSTWFHGPDLWVRHFNDGIPVHLDPEFGQTNYVYGNVHNIGCGTAGNISVEFSWVQQSGWNNPAAWNPIATANIPLLPSLASTSVVVPWSTVPVPGTYCMHTRLNTAGDLENAYGEAYRDNNKVQINVEVKDTWAGAGWMHFFFVENASKKPTSVDLAFELRFVPKDAQISLELPPEIRFEKVIGAEISKNPDGWTVLHFVPSQKRVMVFGVPLASMEKHRVFMTTVLPPTSNTKQWLEVMFTEQVRGRTKGGIRIVRRAGKPEQVVCQVLSTKMHVFDAVAERFGLDEARYVAKLAAKLVESRECRNMDAFREIMGEISKLECALGEFMQKISPRHARRYLRACKDLDAAVTKGDPGDILEKQQKLTTITSLVLAEDILKD